VVGVQRAADGGGSPVAPLRASVRRPRGLRRRPLAVALLAVLALALVSSAIRPTSSAWTNPAYVTANATSGSWAVAGPLGSCVVVSDVAPYDPISPAPPCTITALTYSAFGDGAPVGSRHANMYINVTATVTSSQLIKLSFNLMGAAGIPANWSYATSALENGNVSQYPGFLCSSMSTGVYITLAPSWAGGGSQVYLGKLYENRFESGKHTFTCSP
jgi:hypothetical protein